MESRGARAPSHLSLREILSRVGALVLRDGPDLEARWRGLPIRVGRGASAPETSARLDRAFARLAALPDPATMVEIQLHRDAEDGKGAIRVPMVNRGEAEAILDLCGDPFLVYFDRDTSAMTILGRALDSRAGFVSVEHRLPPVTAATHTTGAERTARVALPDLVVADSSRRAEKFARLRPRLRCVRCDERSELIDGGGSLSCVSCAARYPLVAGVPILFVDPSRTGEPETDRVSSNGYSRQAVAMFDSIRGGFVLDCGCGSPSENLENVVHLEVTRYANVDVVASCERLPFSDGAFEGIVCESVLEHVPDPRIVVAEFDRTLVRGGRLFVDVPFLAPYHGFPHHYQNFTDSGLAALLSAFEKIDAGIHPHQEPWVAIGWILRCAREGLPTDELRAAFDAATLRELLGAVAGGGAAGVAASALRRDATNDRGGVVLLRQEALILDRRDQCAFALASASVSAGTISKRSPTTP